MSSETISIVNCRPHDRNNSMNIKELNVIVILESNITININSLPIDIVNETYRYPVFQNNEKPIYSKIEYKVDDIDVFVFNSEASQEVCCVFRPTDELAG